MKPRWLLLLALWPALGPALTAAQVMDCELGGQSVNPSNGATTAGKTGLMRCVDRGSRELLREEELRNGRSVGVQRWYEGGRLRREIHVNERGNREGRWREWNAQGVLVREGFDADSRSVGLHSAWSDDGRLVSQSHWGEPPGAATPAEPRPAAAVGEAPRTEAFSRMQFNASGQLTELRCGPTPRLDREALLCGHEGRPVVSELFTERGVLAARVTHERGVRLRSENYWDNGQARATEALQGTQRTVEHFSRNGSLRKRWVGEGNRPLLEQDHSERGTLVTEKRWNAAGAIEREAQWFLNGQLQREVLHQASAADGSRSHVERGFRDDGRLAFEGTYLSPPRGRTVPVGSHKRWDEAGRLRQETIYDDRGRLQRERSWDGAGRVLRDDEVFEDGSRRGVER
jgi:antitoxin component YwqK of YwqJK toxin-antitoxin module